MPKPIIMRKSTRSAAAGLVALAVCAFLTAFDFSRQPGSGFAVGPVGTTLASDGKLRWYRGNLHTHSMWSDGDDYLEFQPEHAPEMLCANARLNGVGSLCRPLVSRGVEKASLREGAPYDLVFANILAKPLRLLAPSLARVMAADGEAIVSGLLAPDVPGALSAWRAQGFFLAERIDLDGWASLSLAALAARG